MELVDIHCDVFEAFQAQEHRIVFAAQILSFETFGLVWIRPSPEFFSSC
jgi:hypothetical protein